MLGLASTWLVIVSLLLILAWLFGKELVDEANTAHLRYEARLIAQGLTEEVKLRQHSLERLAERMEGRQPGELQQLLQDNQSLLAWFEGVMVTGADGTVLADWPVVEGRTGLETARTEYFRMVRQSPWPYVSEPFVGRASGASLVLMLVPRIDAKGGFQGIVGGIVNLQRGGLFRRLETTRLGEGGFASVFTASGKLLFHPFRSDTAVNMELIHQGGALERALDGWQGEAVMRAGESDAALVAYRQIWPADWVVSVVLPTSQIYAPLGGFLGKLWWAWLGAAALLLISMRWLVKRLLAPLHRLEQQIAEVGAGARHSLALSTQMGELRQVANTFNLLEGERRSALEHLRDREAFLDAVLASSPVGIFVASLEGRISYMNPSLLALLGLREPARMGEWRERIHPDDLPGAEDLWRHALATGNDFVRQLRFHDGNDGTLWLEVHASQVHGNGTPLGMVGMVKDITERRQQEALQRWEAEHDPLTGLLNRRGFERRLEEALAECTKTGTPSVLIAFDLDHFKPINDEGGHALGDEMLRRIAQVVAWEIRRSDHVARQGGDEFAVLLPSCTLAQATKIAESLRQAVEEIEVSQAGKKYRVTLSTGVASLQESDVSIDAVMSRADRACYQAKAGGRNAVVVCPAAERGADRGATGALFECSDGETA